MLKLASLSLVAILALTSVSLAKPSAKEAAPAARVCQTPDAIIKKTATDATVVEDLKGDVLKKFNAAYAAASGEEAPDSVMDRVVVFASKANPDIEVYMMLFSKNDCALGVQPIPKKLFNKYRHPGEGI